LTAVSNFAWVGTLAHVEIAADAGRIHVQPAGDLGSDQGELAANLRAPQLHVGNLAPRA
jgi:hypothetical protein